MDKIIKEISDWQNRVYPYFLYSMIKITGSVNERINLDIFFDCDLKTQNNYLKEFEQKLIKKEI